MSDLIMGTSDFTVYNDHFENITNEYIDKVSYSKKSVNKDNDLKHLSCGFTRIVIETDEDNPMAIAVIEDENIEVIKGYRVRLRPKYD